MARPILSRLAAALALTAAALSLSGCGMAGHQLRRVGSLVPPLPPMYRAVGADAAMPPASIEENAAEAGKRPPLA
ncbi:MAG: hypothetical protein KDM91_19555 [Verrucomicrobiae bacterium]|nr:hypothetical protein [Verrucomicrobiae bacterium]